MNQPPTPVIEAQLDTMPPSVGLPIPVPLIEPDRTLNVAQRNFPSEINRG